MRAIVESRWPELLDLATEIVGEDPFTQLSRGTEFVQPAVFCTSMASWRGARAEVEPAAFAGHSLGEFGALVAAEALDIEDALRAVTLRGRLTQRVAEAQAADGRAGGMLAVGTKLDRVSILARSHSLTVANHNSPQQVVLSGPRAALRAAARTARAEGLKTAHLDVEGAFHSPAMAEAVPPFRDALERIRFRRPKGPVFCSTTGRPFDGEVARRLAEGLVEQVRWPEVVLGMSELGVRRFVEPEPGTVLCGLVSKILPDAEVQSATELKAPLGAR
jgi:acyl transferase domain-containing protein